MPDPAPISVPPSPAPAQQGTSLLTAGGIVLAIGGLYFGRDIFVPFALAILLSFALTPLVGWLRHVHLPRIAAVLVAVSLAFVLIGGLTYVIGSQLVQLANNLPSYQTTIREKIRSLQTSAPGGGVVDKVTTTIQDLSKEISGEGKPQAPGTAGTPEGEPLTVRIEREEAQPLDVIRAVVGPLLAPLATAGLVVIFVIFVLLEKEDLRDRFIKLAGAGDLQKSTQALNDAAARVSRYLLMQLVVNLSYGVPLGLGLYLIGVPNAVLWGLLAAVLRFVPYLGPFLAALFPIALSVAVDPGWSMLLWVVSLFLVAELISNNVIEPWLYGASTGLSSLAIIMAAIFWTTLWGPVGLFLATPLTVCLVVIGRYVPQLEFLGVLLGSDPVLAPEERFYQRLVAGNLEEAVELAETYVDEQSAEQFYDQVGIPALRLAENDRQRSTTDTSYRRVVASTATCVVRELADHVEEKAGSEAKPVESAEPPSVLCIAGRTELDGTAAAMLAQVLGQRGIGTKVLQPISVTEGALGQLDLTGIRIVCLSYLHPHPQVFARYICRRLRRRAPHIKLLVCCWNLHPATGQTADTARETSADAVLVTLAASLAQVESWLTQPRPGETASPVVIDDTHEKVEALRALGPGAKRRHLDETTRRVAQAFDVPIALVSWVDDPHPPLQAPGTPPGPEQGTAPAPSAREESICGHVVVSDEVLVAEDVTKDPRFSDNPLVLEKGIRFYAGAPLRNEAGLVLGSLCVIDTKPRSFSEEERRRLQEEADRLMGEILERATASDQAPQPA